MSASRAGRGGRGRKPAPQRLGFDWPGALGSGLAISHATTMGVKQIINPIGMEKMLQN
jgi:hypothetical protein